MRPSLDTAAEWYLPAATAAKAISVLELPVPPSCTLSHVMLLEPHVVMAGRADLKESSVLSTRPSTSFIQHKAGLASTQPATSSLTNSMPHDNHVVIPAGLNVVDVKEAKEGGKIRLLSVNWDLQQAERRE